MSHPGFMPRFMTAAVVLLALRVGSVRELRAQDAVAPQSVSSPVAPSVGAAQAPAEPAATSSAPAGPRVTPPLERYQGTLPQRSGAESAAMDSEGSRHTIVLSTLAIVLIAIIVVLLVT